MFANIKFDSFSVSFNYNALSYSYNFLCLWFANLTSFMSGLQVGDEKHTTRKRSLVLGADPEPKQKRGKRFNSNKKTRPLYNHC